MEELSIFNESESKQGRSRFGVQKLLEVIKSNPKAVICIVGPSVLMIIGIYSYQYYRAAPSREHARKAVELLRKFQSEAKIGVQERDSRKTLSEAQFEFDQIRRDDIDGVAYAAIETSLLSHQLILRNDEMRDSEIKRASYLQFDGIWKKYKERLTEDWKNAVEMREMAAEKLGV